MIKRIHILFILALLISGCKKPFIPSVISQNNSFLVIEGVINTGNDSTKIKLSRTVNLNDSVQTVAENGAKVYVETDQHKRYDLTELSGGVYASAPLKIQNVAKCRLHILTVKNKEYVSDYADNIITPPIDSITYDVKPAGLQLYGNTHDPQNKISYYRWEFDETWEYVSFYQSIMKYENQQVVPRNGENIYRCWISKPSHQIAVASSTGLTQAVINRQPLAFINQNSGKLALGYSMLLRQYALSKEAYEYWQKLKKNTEQLGGIFDAQPSEIRGNVHSTTDAEEPVIGYVSVCTVSSKRFIIGHSDIPLYTMFYFPPPSEQYCADNTKIIPLEPANTFQLRLIQTFGRGDSVLIYPEGANGVLIGYSYAPAECVDCRAKMASGTNKRPAYWPNNIP